MCHAHVNAAHSGDRAAAGTSLDRGAAALAGVLDVLQMPAYGNPSTLADVEARLATYPPLVFAGEARTLKDRLAEVSAGQAFLLDHGKNGPRNEIPVLIDADGNHRLDIEHILRAFEWAVVEIGIVLERQADQVADRVLGKFSKLFSGHFGVSY